MMKEKEYLTLDEVEAYTGIKKGSLYYYFKALRIETIKFNLDKRAYISFADANRIKEIKDTPWIAGKKQPQKVEKRPVSPQTSNLIKEKKQPQKQRSVSKQKDTKTHTSLPDGCILASQFATDHGIARPTFIDHMTKGLGPGLIGMSTDTIPQRDQVAYSERPKPRRPHEKEKYLTSDQQRAAFEFWKRHNVSFAECNDFGCWCHTILQENN